jgi:hypothetical protein
MERPTPAFNFNGEEPYVVDRPDLKKYADQYYFEEDSEGGTYIPRKEEKIVKLPTPVVTTDFMDDKGNIVEVDAESSVTLPDIGYRLGRVPYTQENLENYGGFAGVAGVNDQIASNNQIFDQHKQLLLNSARNLLNRVSKKYEPSKNRVDFEKANRQVYAYKASDRMTHPGEVDKAFMQSIEIENERIPRVNTIIKELEDRIAVLKKSSDGFVNSQLLEAQSRLETAKLVKQRIMDGYQVKLQLSRPLADAFKKRNDAKHEMTSAFLGIETPQEREFRKMGLRFRPY